MTVDEYKAQVGLVATSARAFRTVLQGVDLETIWRTLERADAVAPILDPTAYRDALHSGRLDEQRHLVELVIQFARQFDELEAEVLGNLARAGRGRG